MKNATASKKPVRSETIQWGPLSKHIYEQSKRPLPVPDESPPPAAPYAKVYFTTAEYMAYRDQMDETTRALFLLIVAFSLQSEGL